MTEGGFVYLLLLPFFPTVCCSASPTFLISSTIYYIPFDLHWLAKLFDANVNIAMPIIALIHFGVIEVLPELAMACINSPFMRLFCMHYVCTDIPASPSLFPFPAHVG